MIPVSLQVSYPTVQEVYKNRHQKDLAQAIRDETSGDYQDLLVSLVEVERDDIERVVHPHGYKR